MRWLLIAALLLGCDVVDLDSAAEPVIGGRVVAAGEYPEVAALVNDDGDPYCTGTLIRDDAILTAAHCLVADPDPAVTFANDAREIAGPPLVSITSAEAHPSFDFDRAVSPGVSEYFDIAVLILAEPVGGVAPARLPEVVDAEANLIPGDEVELVGYGARVDDGSLSESGEKAQGVATIIAVGDNEVQISMPGEQQSCNGDSGGPTYLDIPGAGTRLVAVISRSADNDAACDSGSVNTRVDAYLDFIDAALGGSDPGGDSDGGSGGGSGGGGSGTGGGGIGEPRDSGGCSISGGHGSGVLWWLLVATLVVLNRAGARDARPGRPAR